MKKIILLVSGLLIKITFATFTFQQYVLSLHIPFLFQGMPFTFEYIIIVENLQNCAFGGTLTLPLGCTNDKDKRNVLDILEW